MGKFKKSVGGRKVPFGNNYKKECKDHLGEIAIYCEIERRWICPKCLVNSKIKEGKCLQVTSRIKKRGRRNLIKYIK